MSNWLHNLRLKKKFFLLLMAATLSLSFAEIINRQNAYNEYNRQAYEKNAQMVNLYMNYLDTVFQRMEQVTYGFIADQFLQDELIELREWGINSSYFDSEDVLAMIRTYVNKEPYFSTFLLRTEYKDFVFGKVTADDEKLKKYMKTAEGKNGKLQMISEEGQLVLVREIRQVKNFKLTTLAYVIAWADFHAVMDDIRASFTNADNDMKLAIYDKDICLYSDYKSLAEYREAKDGWYINGEDFITVYTSPAFGYTMMIRTSYGEIQALIRSVYIRSIVTSVLVAAVALAISNFLVDWVLRDLDKLVCKMDDFGEGKLPEYDEEKVYKNRKDEIGRLYRHFYRMIRDYQKVTEEYYNNKILLLESEYSRLQKQIQPHFLYNTLSTISWRAYANKDLETADMIETLGRMMRRITDSKELLTSVENDLRIAEDYLKIQQQRFGKRLKVDIKISNSTMCLSIPPISIQPLVENSVTYVMDAIVSCCEIRIFDRIEKNAVEIIVEDNGPGCEEDILENLHCEDLGSGGSGIALRNIHTRLQYAFSQDYGIRLKRLENGMQVIIRIPEQ